MESTIMSASIDNECVVGKPLEKERTFSTMLQMTKIERGQGEEIENTV